MSPHIFPTIDAEIEHLEEWQSRLADKRREALTDLRRLYRKRQGLHDDVRADGVTEMLRRLP